MRLLIGAVASFFALTFVSAAGFTQQATSQVPNSGTRQPPDPHEMIVSLLQQSRALNNLFAGQGQDFVIREQIQFAEHEQQDLARQWANELFAQAAEEKGAARSNSQDYAMSVLVRLDPDRALELLHSVDWNSVEGSSNSPFPPGRELVRQVFQALANRNGEAALPVVEQEADFIASKGTYPYSAVGGAVSSATAKDWREHREHAIEVQQSALDRMLGKYRATPHTYAGDLEFGDMLRHLAGYLPIESIKPALHLLVDNLLTTDTSKYQSHATVYTSDGQTAKSDNAIDAALLWFGPLVNRDPELVQQLSSIRPELRESLEYTKPGRMRGGSFGGRAGPPKSQPADPARETAMDAMRFTHIQPDIAIAKAESLPDGPQRSHTLLDVARGISGDNPERAAQLIAEASGDGSQQGDVEMRLDVTSVKSSIAAAQGNKAELRTLLQSGFELAAHSDLENARFGGGVGGLVQIGMQNEPELTLAFLQGLPASQEKAHLLLAAVAALEMHQALPIRSSTPNKP